jgi:hypothetical protein
VTALQEAAGALQPALEPTDLSSFVLYTVIPCQNPSHQRSDYVCQKHNLSHAKEAWQPLEECVKRRFAANLFITDYGVIGRCPSGHASQPLHQFL